MFTSKYGKACTASPRPASSPTNYSRNDSDDMDVMNATTRRAFGHMIGAPSRLFSWSTILELNIFQKRNVMWLMSCLCGVLLGGDLALYNSDTCHLQPAIVPRVIFVWL